MSLSEKELEHLEDLARIRLKQDLREKFRFQLDSIIGFVAELQKVDVSGYENAVEQGSGMNRLRGDKPEESLKRKTILEEAPESNSGFFSVPPVIESDDQAGG